MVKYAVLNRLLKEAAHNFIILQCSKYNKYECEIKDAFIWKLITIFIQKILK